MKGGGQGSAGGSDEQANGGGHSLNQRGLDSGLAKAAPSAEKLDSKSYRSYRRRLLLFAKQCSRRGNNVAVEGAYLTLSLLQDSAWEAAEQLNIDDIENEADPFAPILRLLDRLYQFEEDVELPSRCEEFFQDFSPLKGEEMQAYLIRHATLRKKMLEVKVEVPDLLAGWHLLSRAGAPKWTHLQVKTLCGGVLSYTKVAQALLKMFGGDHKPNAKDLFRSTGGHESSYVVDDYDDAYYYEELDDYHDDGWWEDEAYAAEHFGDDEPPADDDVPEDVELAVEEMEDAYINYVDSRRKMKEIALARGFCPIVAVPPSDFGGSDYGKSYGKGKSKGKGRAKGKGKGKGGGKGSDKGGFRKFAFSRRPTSGLRRDAASNNPLPSSDAMRSTGSGSTSAHGPRFKRYRLQDAATKQADEANMVEEVPNSDTAKDESKLEEACQVNINAGNHAENVFFNEVRPGFAIMDSGATKSVIGEESWKKWLLLLERNGIKPQAKKVTRDFRFGDGSVVRSSVGVSFEVTIFGHSVLVAASLIPGGTPLLPARPVLEDWKVAQDFASGKIKLLDSEQWITPTRTSNGHFLFQLVDSHGDQVLLQDATEEVYVETPLILNPGEPPDDNDEKADEADTKEMDVEDSEIQAAIRSAEQAIYFNQIQRDKAYWEMYVDKGNLSQRMARMPGTTASTFGLPEWDLENAETQNSFKTLVKDIMPLHIWMAPPCTLWTAMQSLACRTEAQKQDLLRRRRRAMKRTLKFVYEIFLLCIEMGTHATIEHPRRSLMWQTPPINQLQGPGIFDTVVDRCRTGLTAKDEHGNWGPVRKQTLLRTTSANLFNAMSLQCTCQVPHVQMAGKAAALKDMQNYEQGFVSIASRAIQKDLEETWARRQAASIMMMEDVEVVPDGQHAVEALNKDLVRKVGRNNVLTIAKLHKQLGHPGKDHLLEAVRASQLGTKMMQAAREYKCSICEQHSSSSLARPGSLSTTTSFNQVLLVDSFFIRWHGTKHAVLALMDQFSRFEQLARAQDEQPDTEIALIEDVWIRWAGTPACIKTDASGSHMSEAFLSWADSRGIRLAIIPRDAHYKLGSMERAHAVRHAGQNAFGRP